MKMKNWKRITARALSICIMATCTPCLAEAGGLLPSPVTVHAETSDVVLTGTCGKNATWNYNRTTKVLTISGSGSVPHINGVERYQKEIKKLVFSDTITGIGISAFQDCTALEDIQFGGVKVIRRFAFEGCTALKSLDLDGNITQIGTEAFRNCTNLTTVTVGSKVKTVYEDIFKGCDNLTSIDVSKNNTYLYADGKKLLISKFSGTCGKNVKYSYNAKTKTLTLSGSGAIDNTISEDGCTIINYNLLPSLHSDAIMHEMQTLIVGDKVTSIGSYTFPACDALKTVKLGKNVSTIGSHAFAGCTALKTIQSGNNIKSIGERAFSDCSKLSKIRVLTNLTKIGSYSFYGCKSLKTFSIGKSVKSIGEGAFSECTSLSKLSVHKNNSYFTKRDNMLLNKSQTKIVSACFGSNKTCKIYNSVKEIDKTILEDSSVKRFVVNKKNSTYSAKGGLLYSKNGKTLQKCPSAMSGIVNIDDSVTTIARDAFQICNNITQINIGKNVKTINNFACTISAEKLDAIQISSKNKYYYETNGSLISKANDELLFCFKIDGDTYTIPDSVKKIGSYAFGTQFGTQRNLKKIILSNSTKIDPYAFLTRDGTGSLVAQSQIESIHLEAGYNNPTNNFFAFSSLHNLNEITVSSENPNYTSIDGVLYDKDGKELLSLPKTRETYTIPDSVTGYNDDFHFSGELKNLTISDTITDATDWLALSSDIESLHIGKNVTTLYDMPALKYISVDEENSTFKAVNNMLYSKDGSKFLLCPAQTEGKVVLEEGMTEIAAYAFHNCKYITDIVIPDTVSKIDDNAFESLDYIVIWVPKGKKDYYKSLFTEQTGFTDNMVIMELEN